jgi:hypothetical protein
MKCTLLVLATVISVAIAVWPKEGNVVYERDPYLGAHARGARDGIGYSDYDITRTARSNAKSIFSWDIPQPPPGQKLHRARLKLPQQRTGNTPEFNVRRVNKYQNDRPWNYYNMEKGKRVTKKNRRLNPGGEINVKKHVKKAGAGNSIHFAISAPKQHGGQNTFNQRPELEFEYR